MTGTGSIAGSPAVSVAMLGARMHYAVPRLLNEAGLLNYFFTDSYVGNKPWLQWALERFPASLRPKEAQRWLGRRSPGLEPGRVVSFELFGIWYAAARRRAQTREEVEVLFQKAGHEFNRHILAKGLGETRVVWGYNTASLELFRAARRAGLRCVLEQTILPRSLELQWLREEEDAWPSWSARQLAVGTSLLADLEEEEWELADCIVAGSEFVKDGLVARGVPEAKIRVVAYGVDPEQFRCVDADPEKGGGKLKVLFAGQVGLRKGIPYLLEALRKLPPNSVETRIVGPIDIEPSRLSKCGDDVSVLGAVPRSEMGRLLRWADVLVLPSIVEGSATVTYEALMSGRPVIATPNAGSIVRDGVDGCVVPVRDVPALREALFRYASDRALLRRHQQAAAEGRERAGLSRYGVDLVDTIRAVAGGAAA
jgi:hypothetical protein